MSRILADYHIHTNFSPDGRSRPEEICRAALSKGLTEIAVTDHYECFIDDANADAEYSLEIIAAGLAEMERCRGELTVRKGLELGQPHHKPAMAKRLLTELSLDFVLCSAHKLRDVDKGEMDYTEEVIPGRVREELAMLYEIADGYDYDCLAHLDIIKRYAAFHGIKVDLLDYREELEPILHRVIERGKGIELNTSGLRQAAREGLPSLGILKLYRSLGGEILTVGSDAHLAKDVGGDFDTARELALAAGFRYLTTFEKRKPAFYSIV